ncbi:hypothetical protein [Bacillus sp. FJAT-27225]|uniref:hypothetical protein n=1 Tax=Bacillus sp. FJAT-27225 TaxID=1743144 RepID=UPI000AA9024C|nr:hypothetical protein [Bacillus sp. FJAT-27225]
MIKKFLSVVLAASFALSANGTAANAEGNFTTEKFPYEEMQIQVMPEFDYPENWPKEEPSLLVGQYGTITNKTGGDFTGKVEIPVPVNEKGFQIYLVAEFPSPEKPEVQRPFEVDKERGVVVFRPQKPIKKDGTYSFVVEYYSNPLSVKGSEKSFKYEYKAPSAIETLDVIVYAPLKSTDIVMDPKPASTQKSEYGEQIAFYQQKGVKQGDAIKYGIFYKKEGNASTLSMIDTAKAPNDENHSGQTATDQVVGAAANNGGGNGNGDRPIIGAAGGTIIGASIIIAGMFVFFGLKNRAENRNHPAPKKKTKDKKPAETQKKKNDLNVDEIKELRKKLLSGKIDQEAYDEQVKKLI